MKLIKSLKLDRSLPSLSTKELNKVKGGGTGSLDPFGHKNPDDIVSGDPPPEIEASYRYIFR